jgi:stage V sporulation protein R
MDYARDVLENVQRIWKRPVSLETWVDDRPAALRYDGSRHTHDTAKADRLAV